MAAGLTLAGASAISHDLYANVIARGRSNEGTEIRISEIATFCLGLLAIVSLLDDSDRAKQERLGFEAQRVRCETGIGAEGAASH